MAGDNGEGADEMLKQLRSWLLSLARDPSPNTCAPALRGAVTEARAQAYAELREAESKGDTRRIGKARMVLTQATTDELADRVWG